MTVFTAILLGIVEGLTEFLPISSSGHLVFIRELFGIESSGIFFDAMLHLGTLVSVPVVMRKELMSALRPKTVMLLAAATLPAVAAALLLSPQIEEAFSGRGIYIGFFCTSAILVLTYLLMKKKQKNNTVRLGNAVSMGIMQAAAIFPGLSRSGFTIFGGVLSGLEPDTAAGFSVLMSIPAILGSAVLGGYEAISSGSGSAMLLSALAGACAAFVTGCFSIKLLVNAYRKKRVLWLAAYTAVMGAVCLIFF